jgi:hypothetical protein
MPLPAMGETYLRDIQTAIEMISGNCDGSPFTALLTAAMRSAGRSHAAAPGKTYMAFFREKIIFYRGVWPSPRVKRGGAVSVVP